MIGRICRVTACAATVLALGMVLVATPAMATELTNWAVWGYLTPKKTNEPVNLPKGSTFNGSISVFFNSESEVSGTASGTIYVPPFKTTVKLGGLVPTEVGVTFTQVGPAAGTITGLPAADCAGTHFGGDCVNFSVTAHADVGLTAVGLLGIDAPAECETSEPITFPMSTTAALGELIGEGAHFKGTVTIPSIKCAGLDGIAEGALLTEVMSGPENQYNLHIGPEEPSAPTITSEGATSVSQVSAMLNATVVPHGEELTNCHFEYGPTTSYGESRPCRWIPRAGDVVQATASGLGEGAPYHYRVVATNPLGTSYGADETFTTLSSSVAPQYGTCRALKHGSYSDSNCVHMSAKAGKGSYEYYPGPAPSCVAKKKGDYNNAACTEKAAKSKKGSYEKTGGAGFSVTTGSVTLEAPELARTVVCTAGSGSGEVTGASSGTERIKLTGCESSGKSCTSEGANSTPSGEKGVIESNLLRTRLLGPVEGAAWTQLTSAEHEPYVSEFSCEGTVFRTSGSLSGVQLGDVSESSATSTTTFTYGSPDLSGGEQAILTSVSENGGSSWVGPDPSWELMKATITAASPIEIRP